MLPPPAEKLQNFFGVFLQFHIGVDILKSGLLQKISSAEEEFNNMPIEKAGRLFVQLAKAEADRKRTDYATKRKAELAFDQMEADLLAQVRQYPDLAAQLKDVLNQARTRIASADLE